MMPAAFNLNLNDAWVPDGTRSLQRALPLELQTPSARFAHGLEIPTLIDGFKPVVTARLAVQLSDVHGEIRIGVLNRPGGSEYLDSKIVQSCQATTVELKVSVAGRPGPLVVQNMREQGASSFTLLAVDALEEASLYPTDRDERLLRYMRNGFNNVEGWCSYLNIAFLREMDELLFADSVDGGVGEIGIHHGKQFIALHNLMSSGAKSLAIDVFGAQEFNLDQSGSGDRAKFLENLAAWGANPENCVVVERDSLSLRARDLDELHKAVGDLKFFGIDGCHEVEHTISDMHAAMSLVAHGGVIVLDDFLNPDFPGVHQAVAYLFINGRPGIAPFVIGQNKLYLTQVSHHSRYLNAAKTAIGNIRETATVRQVNLYGYPVLSWRSSESSWNFPTTC
jgi:Methyltransferase domain